MIITKFLPMKINVANRKRLLELGYIGDIGSVIVIDIKDLAYSSHYKVLCKCDICDTEKMVVYKNYNKITDKNSTYYYCKKCSKYKQISNNNKKYGYSCTLNVPQFREKTIDTLQKRYNVTNVSQIKSVCMKRKETNRKLFNSDSYLHSDHYKEYMKNILHPSKEDMFKFNINLKTFNKYKTILEESLSQDSSPYIIESCDFEKLTISIKHICGHSSIYNYTNLSYDMRNHKILCDVCGLYNGISVAEQNIKDYISSLNIDYISNDNSVLNGKHIDIYIPDKNIGIEYNGIYYHSNRFKPNNYHYTKTIDAYAKNIDLIHIYEDEYMNNKDIIEIYLKDILTNSNIINIEYDYDIMVTDNSIIMKYENNNIAHFNLYKIVESSIEIDFVINDPIYISNRLFIFSELFKTINKQFKDYNIYFYTYQSSIFNILLKDKDFLYKLGFIENNILEPNRYLIKNKKRYLDLDLDTSLNNEDKEELYIYDSGKTEWLYTKL